MRAKLRTPSGRARERSRAVPLLAPALLIAVAAARVGAAPGPAEAIDWVIFDDFEDGDIADGDPIFWDPVLGQGNHEVAGGRLAVCTEGKATLELQTDHWFEGDVSVRARLRLTDTPGYVSVYARGGGEGGRSSYVGDFGVNSQGFGVQIFRCLQGQPCRILTQTALDPASFSPTQWHDLQLDIRGERLELRVWRSGTEAPAAPLLAVVDTALKAGYVGISTWRCGEYDEFWAGAPVPPPPPEVTFERGDANGDGRVDIADPVRVLGALFLSAPPVPCPDAADGDDTGELDLTDAIYLLGYLFLGDPEPPPPFGACGPDPTPDELEECGDGSIACGAER